MNEGYVSTGRVWASVAWAATIGVGLVAWGLMLIDHHWAFMFALTAGVMAPFAATLHVRTYFVRMCSLVRDNREAIDRGVSQIKPLR